MAQILDLQEWDECLGKMIRYHSNISMEIRDLILKIRDWRDENSSFTYYLRSSNCKDTKICRLFARASRFYPP